MFISVLFSNIVIVFMDSDSAVVFQYLETVVHGRAASESAAGVPYGLPFLISKMIGAILCK